MRRIWQLPLMTLTLSAMMSAGEPSAEAKQAVSKAEAEFKAAVLKADGAALDKLLASDLSYTHSSAKTQTKQEFLQDATGGGTTYKSIDFSDMKMRQYGDTVIVTQKATIVTAQTGTNHLYLTEVWAKQGGHWQMATRQATKLP